MRAFDPEVFDTVFAAIEPLLPVHNETHPLGCHRPRALDRDCFEVMPSSRHGVLMGGRRTPVRRQGL
jgi:hypothetical protein